MANMLKLLTNQHKEIHQNSARRGQNYEDDENEGGLEMHQTKRPTMKTMFDVPDVSSESEKLSSVSSESSILIGVLDVQEMARHEAELTEYLLEETNALFDSLDILGNGYLTRSDIKSAYQTFGIDIDLDDCRIIIDAFDTTGQGIITCADLYREMRDVMLGGTTHEQLKMVFDAIDVGGDGLFGPEDIMRQFQKVGALVDHEETLDAFRSMNDDGTDLVDFTAFTTYCEALDKFHLIAHTPVTGFYEEEEEEAKKDRRKSRVSRKCSVAGSTSPRKISKVSKISESTHVK